MIHNAKSNDRSEEYFGCCEQATDPIKVPPDADIVPDAMPTTQCAAVIKVFWPTAVAVQGDWSVAKINVAGHTFESAGLPPMICGDMSGERRSVTAIISKLKAREGRQPKVLMSRCNNGRLNRMPMRGLSVRGPTTYMRSPIYTFPSSIANYTYYSNEVRGTEPLANYPNIFPKLS